MSVILQPVLISELSHSCNAMWHLQGSYSFSLTISQNFSMTLPATCKYRIFILKRPEPFANDPIVVFFWSSV